MANSTCRSISPIKWLATSWGSLLSPVLSRVILRTKKSQRNKEVTMETRATLRGVRLSVDKGRLVADLIRGKKVDQALNILQFTQKKAAVIIRKVLESAIANAEHNDGADIDELKVKTIYVEQGASRPALKAVATKSENPRAMCT